MSQRAAETLRDDLEARGPVRLVEVEAAQKEITGTARRLAEEGTITLGPAAGDDYV
jgi:flagellar motor switch protein FliG